MQLLTPGQETYMNIRRAPSPDGQPGPVVLVVLISLFTSHVSLTFTGHHILNRSLPVAEGRAYLAYLQAEVVAGTPMWLLIERAGMWTSAAAAADDAEADLVDDINATLDGATAVRTQVTAQLRAEVDTILADADPNWARKLRAEVVQAAKKHNEPRDYSKTRVHRQEPTPAELHAIRHHTVNPDGTLTVKAQPGQNWLTLKALYGRIGGERTYRAGTRRVIESLTYRPEQLAGYLTSERAA